MNRKSLYEGNFLILTQPPAEEIKLKYRFFVFCIQGPGHLRPKLDCVLNIKASLVNKIGFFYHFKPLSQ